MEEVSHKKVSVLGKEIIKAGLNIINFQIEFEEVNLTVIKEQLETMIKITNCEIKR